MKADEATRHVIWAGVLGLVVCVSASAQTAPQKADLVQRTFTWFGTP